MTVRSLIAELETYDPNLPIVLEKEGNFRSLSFADIQFGEKVSVNEHKEGDAIIILGYDD